MTEKIPGLAESIQQQPAVNQEFAESKKIEFSAEIDSAGVRFDPAIHRVHPDGTPKRGKQGQFLKIYGSGKNQGPENSENSENEKLSGKVLSTIYFRAGVFVFGPAWLPKKMGDFDEQAMIEAAITDYCRATGKVDIPPGVALAVAVLSHVGRVISEPESAGTVEKIKNSIKKFFSKNESSDPGND